MMRDKTYYKQLCDSWMDASIQKADERRLKAFLAATDDPDFDEIKAVAGFFECGKAIRGNVHRRPFMWYVPATAAAAVLAIVLAVGTTGTSRARKAEIASMESTLTAFFSSGVDVEASLSELIDR